ncbi:BUD31-like protein [Gregarina niphandrodes]|uniref:BUD31-like protein n=1 Tax=Gregarina niphandrodes TaxID=110365 RepID=A0A023AY96_GRENI|nr:BUD31-like protein [Gregarina niphandrodes]EZG43631.1 BUD31-like protein [Gregarina niphandrodes]|eukprot:XP_011133134.1 BUD31-like protein [Gregarina niphandrodes]
MPNIRTLQKGKRPPPGWDLLEPTLVELEAKMRQAEKEPHEGKRKCESLWPVFKLHNQRSRYIYDMFYTKKAISRELYDYCLREKWADAGLIAKWKKNGFEKLCCLKCIEAAATNFGSACICRVPKKDQPEDKLLIECVNCGCRGCASTDV